MSDTGSRAPVVVIRRLDGDAQARACATLMSTSEPWIRFGRDFEKSYALVRDPSREVYVAVSSVPLEMGSVLGFVVLLMQGAFVGYVQSLAVDDSLSRARHRHGVDGVRRATRVARAA